MRVLVTGGAGSYSGSLFISFIEGLKETLDSHEHKVYGISPDLQ